MAFCANFFRMEPFIFYLFNGSFIFFAFLIKSLNSACIGLDAQGQNDCVVCAFGFYYSDVYYPLEKSLNEESKFGVEACINSEKYIGNPNISVFIGVPSNYINNDNETGKGSL